MTSSRLRHRGAHAIVSRGGGHLTTRFILPILLLLAGITSVATTQAADPPMTADQALTLLRGGKRDEARQAFQSILAAHPSDPSDALFGLGLMDVEDGKWRDAMPLVQQLVNLRPSSFAGWELMIQVYQAAGALEDRDAAIQSLYTAWHSASEPAVRSQVAFARDRIFGPRHTVLAKESLDPGGDDIVRFVFEPTDGPSQQRHLIVVRSDGETNERWREDGTVSYGTVVYHLDTLEQLPSGRLQARPYEFYLTPPDYDRVRAKVAGILDGSVLPLSGSADPFWAGEPSK
jgi:tetratricopeptide (TPR) repeat protein